jgi:hypothetical protein
MINNALFGSGYAGLGNLVGVVLADPVLDVSADFGR